MLFNFQLFSFPDLITERSAAQMPAGRSPLSWYHLTDGWYWLDVGTTQLFRYTKTCFAQLTQPSGRAFHEPYVDYHIEAFWNDLTAILPAVFEPLPLALAQRLHSLSAWNDWMAAYAAWGEVCGTNDGDRDEEVEHYMDVLNWWSERRLDTSYLVAGPTGYATRWKRTSGEVKKEITRGKWKQTKVSSPHDELRGKMTPIREQVS